MPDAPNRVQAIGGLMEVVAIPVPTESAAIQPIGELAHLVDGISVSEDDDSGCFAVSDAAA